MEIGTIIDNTLQLPSGGAIERAIIAIITSTLNLKEEIAIVDLVVKIRIEALFIRIFEEITREIIKAIKLIKVKIQETSQREKILSDKNLLIDSRARKDVAICVITRSVMKNQEKSNTSRKVFKKEAEYMIETTMKSLAPIILIFLIEVL